MEAEGNLECARRPPGQVLPISFYRRNTLDVARDVLGCLLCRREVDGSWSVGRIVETEAYKGEDDPACHASAGLTPRTRVLFGPSGRAYVYFTYGMHYLVNLVTEKTGYPGAVLIRAIEPVYGIRVMSRRRRRTGLRELGSGPSKLCQALDIDLRLNGVSLRGPDLVVRNDGLEEQSVENGPRVGIRVGTRRPWRFWLSENPYVSPGRSGPPGRKARRDAG